jgi:hypothetical protein
MMNNKIGRDLEGGGGSQNKVLLSRHLLDGLRKTTKLDRKAGVPGEIRTRHWRYHYTNFLGNATLALSSIAL